MIIVALIKSKIKSSDFILNSNAEFITTNLTPFPQSSPLPLSSPVLSHCLFQLFQKQIPADSINVKGLTGVLAAPIVPGVRFS
jgi:hypothetical protein